jgi:uncharacterized protein YjiS (DUF1127 family)
MNAIPGVSASVNETAPEWADVATRALLRCINWLTAMWRHRRDLELLAGLDDHMLADIGLTRTDLHAAIAEPRWRDPTVLLSDRQRERRENCRRAVIRFAGQGAGTTVRFRADDAGALTGSAVITW